MAILSPMPRISIRDYREQIQLRAVKAGLELGASGLVTARPRYLLL